VVVLFFLRALFWKNPYVRLSIDMKRHRKKYCI